MWVGEGVVVVGNCTQVAQERFSRYKPCDVAGFKTLLLLLLETAGAGSVPGAGSLPGAGSGAGAG